MAGETVITVKGKGTMSRHGGQQSGFCRRRRCRIFARQERGFTLAGRTSTGISKAPVLSCGGGAAQRGFSLLEIIVVLAIMGLILVGVAAWARKVLDERHRQIIADAIAADVSGILQFVSADTIPASVNPAPVKTDPDPDDEPLHSPSAERIINPLYQREGDAVYQGRTDSGWPTGPANNPIVKIHSNIDTDDPWWGRRSYSAGISFPITNVGYTHLTNYLHGTAKYTRSYSLRWSEQRWPGRQSARGFFTDSSCDSGNENGTAAHDTVYFDRQYISCHENPVLQNSEIIIARVDLASSKAAPTVLPRIKQTDDMSVDRVDVYVSFTPVDGRPSGIARYVTPLLKAFESQRVSPNPDEIYVVRCATRTCGYDWWQLINKGNGKPFAAGLKAHSNEVMRIADLPDNAGRLNDNDNGGVYVYALRFSFDGHGAYLRADGTNSASKLCWNTAAGRAGPCIEAPATEHSDLLTIRQRTDTRQFADLQVRDVVLRRSEPMAEAAYNNDGNKTAHETAIEYYTAAHTQYMTFPNTRDGLPLNGNGQRDPLTPVFYDPNANGENNGGWCKAEKEEGRCDPQSPPTVAQIMDPTHGAISIPIQYCPAAKDNQGDAVPMHPRLSVSVSSVISGLQQRNDTKSIETFQSGIFDQQHNTISGYQELITAMQNSSVTINRLGGVMIQQAKYPLDGAIPTHWHIGNVMYVEETSSTGGGHAWLYPNSPAVSVLVTTWCSSNPQI